MTNVYLDLTAEFNAGKLRAIISSGQAVVLHRLAIMSKDGDWILKEDAETMRHVLEVLQQHGARYRFGTPLDVRWMAHGWSAHFEFREQNLRIRTDFVTRPARIGAEQLAAIWREVDPARPVVSPEALIEIKKTNREKDYAVIGELARLLSNPREQMLYSRSGRDLRELARLHPALVAELSFQRALLRQIGESRAALETALDAERRELIRANEVRLASYRTAARGWEQAWPAVNKQIEALSLGDAHEVVVSRALAFLPFSP